jgi:putative ABC transport system permease protein
VALSLVLLVGAGLLIRSLSALMATDLAFDPRNLLTTSLALSEPDERSRIQLQAALHEDLAALPGVTAVTFTSHMPIVQPWGDPPMWPADRPPVDSSQERTAYLRTVTPGYFGTLGIRLLAGRDLAPSDRAGTPRVLVINDVMAREFFPGRSAIGERVVVTGMAGPAPVECEVVGVVRGARTEGVGREPYATAYASAAQLPLRTISILIRSTLPADALARDVHRAVAARDPDVPVDPLVPMEAIVGESLVDQRVLTLILAAFSAVALLLAALGLYGVLAQHVTQRTQEIGVRMALGAGQRQVMADVLRRTALMVLPGLAIGVLVSLAGARLIGRFLYGVPPTDPVTFVGVVATLAFVALAASAWPAWRAVHVDPVRALRAE